MSRFIMTLVFLSSWFSPVLAFNLPDNLLNVSELQQRFSETTAEAWTPGLGRQLLVRYFAADGRLHQVSDGRQTTGHWYLRDDNRLCVDFAGEDKDCRAIIRADDGYRQLAIKLDGNHRHELTYTDLYPGNALNKLSAHPVLPRETLSPSELQDLFIDRTVTSVTAVQGRVSISYYAPDGSVEQVRDGRKRHGRWRITDDARICLQMEQSREKCRIIVRDQEGYKKFVVKNSGRHRHVVSYRAFVDGKGFR